MEASVLVPDPKGAVGPCAARGEMRCRATVPVAVLKGQTQNRWVTLARIHAF